MNRSEQKDLTFLRIAFALGSLGTCDRKRVGAVVTHRGRCVSWGFNGAPPGLPHCSDNDHGWKLAWDELRDRPLMGRPSDWIKRQITEHGCRNATHAEANALAFAARQGISTEGGTLYVTVSPCEVCARLLIAAGIVRVVYDEEYRDRRGIDILGAGGVECTVSRV